MADSFEHKLKGHVRTKMAKHKKIKKHAAMTGRHTTHTLMDELMEHETEREKDASLHELVCEGMQLLFPATSDIISQLNEHDSANSTMLQQALESTCQLHVSGMEIEDLEDLVYFINLMDHETGAWYWDKAKPMLQEAVDERLYVLAREKENDDE